jgi:N-acetylglutamate synthase-like GNAT family acetyltransferase
MLKFLFDLDRDRNRRQYSKEKIRDLDLILEFESKKIEEDSEKSILNVLHKNGEHIIVYRDIFDLEEKFGVFYIALKVIHKRGIVLNRIRLSANYKDEETIEICDIEVFGENEGRGYGSILLQSLINFAIENSVNTISGWISQTDKDHFDKLDSFYKKFGFEVIWDNSSNIANKAADIYWTNLNRVSQ